MKKRTKLKKGTGKNGNKFGMLSVKAGVDKNPNPTQADRIAGATKGKRVKAMGGGAMKKRVMKRGGGMATPKREKKMGGGAMKKRVMKRGGGMMKKPMMKRGGKVKK